MQQMSGPGQRHPACGIRHGDEHVRLAHRMPPGHGRLPHRRIRLIVDGIIHVACAAAIGMIASTPWTPRWCLPIPTVPSRIPMSPAPARMPPPT